MPSPAEAIIVTRNHTFCVPYQSDGDNSLSKADMSSLFNTLLETHYLKNETLLSIKTAAVDGSFVIFAGQTDPKQKSSTPRYCYGDARWMLAYMLEAYEKLNDKCPPVTTKLMYDRTTIMAHALPKENSPEQVFVHQVLCNARAWFYMRTTRVHPTQLPTTEPDGGTVNILYFEPAQHVSEYVEKQAEVVVSNLINGILAVLWAWAPENNATCIGPRPVHL